MNIIALYSEVQILIYEFNDMGTWSKNWDGHQSRFLWIEMDTNRVFIWTIKS